MKQLITLFAVLAGTAALFAAKPEFKDNTLVCGNKKLTFAKNGNITVFSGNKKLGYFMTYYIIRKAPDKKVADWGSYTAKDCSFTIKDNKAEWVLKKTLKDGSSWVAANQTLEILPDGKLQLTVKVSESGSKDWIYDKRSSSIWFMLPANAGKLEFQGKEITPDINVKKYVFTGVKSDFNVKLYSGSPEDSFTVSTENKKIEAINLYPYASQKAFRMTMAPWNHGKTAVINIQL